MKCQIIIDDVVHELVEHINPIPCEECSLIAKCRELGGGLCDILFGYSECQNFKIKEGGNNAEN